jgi:hypothetical protein
VLLAGDLNIRHVDWNSRLSTKRGKLVGDYADEKSCLIFGPDTPTTNPYNPSATADALDIVIPRDLPSVYMTSCSALSPDHLPVIIETSCRSSFQSHRIAMTSGAQPWPNSRPNWKLKFRSIRNCIML